MDELLQPNYILYIHEDYGYQFFEVLPDDNELDAIDAFAFTVTAETTYPVTLIERGPTEEAEAFVEDWGLKVIHAIARDSVRILMLRFGD